MTTEQIQKPKFENDWSWWHSALSGDFGPIHEDQVNAGYYRMKSRKSGRWIPVAIWQDEDNGDWLGQVGKDTPVDPIDVWTWVCMNPIQYSVYAAARSGEGFFDEPPSITPVEYTGCHEEIAALQLELNAEAALIAAEDDTASKADAWAKRLSILIRRADDARKAEKEPFINTGRAIDEKWNGIIQRAKDLKQSLKVQKAV